MHLSSSTWWLIKGQSISRSRLRNLAVMLLGWMEHRWALGVGYDDLQRNLDSRYFGSKYGL
jgi:hypothetical protein